MSHAATNWAIQQRGLKPATKLLLWQLADRHNKDTKRCDPSQDLLAHDAEMSRASVNRHLDELEKQGLIRRVPRLCPKTKKQLSTSYELAHDHTIAVSQIATRDIPEPVSQKAPEPCLKNSDSRVSNCDTNLVIEPGKKPCASEADPHPIDLPSVFLDRFNAVYPRPGNRERTEAALRAALSSGVKPEAILSGARGYAAEQKGNDARYIAYSENWVGQRRWEQFAKPDLDPASAEIVRQRWVDAIVQGETGLARHCSTATAHELIREGLVTAEQCRAVGISV